jgi:hypothetical protein
MIRFVTSHADWLEEILFILFGVIILLAVSALIIMPWRRKITEIETESQLPVPRFEPRRNGRGSFYPWIPVA